MWKFVLALGMMLCAATAHAAPGGDGATSSTTTGTPGVEFYCMYNGEVYSVGWRVCTDGARKGTKALECRAGSGGPGGRPVWAESNTICQVE